jgi:aryl-phospho-beta-D-glucosidase BglC (GH1 family)
MKVLLNFTLIIFILFPVLLVAQISPEQAVEEMGRGINLGNTLEPPFEGNWNNGPAEEVYFDAYEEAGFSNVRIPVRWDEHTGDNSPFTIDSDWMDRVEEVVDWGLSRGFYITLNGHHEDWLKNNYSNPILQDRYDAIWEQVAERFKDKSDKLLFEIINEPNGMTVAEVDDLNERILGIIRETNPTRLVIYGGNMYANAEQLLDAQILDDDYIVAYYHSYDPWSFSGQGQGTWGTDFDYQQVTNKYNLVKNWSNENSIPVHHSEFGAVHACDFNSRMRIYAHNVEQCITNGFAFSVWDDGGNFGILNRTNNTWPEVKEILAHYHPDSPNEIFSTSTTTPNSSQPAILVEWNNRITSTNSIIIERSIGLSDNYIEVATLPGDATSYTDSDVIIANTYTYRMYTTRDDGTLVHGYPTRVKVNATQQLPFNNSPLLIPGTIEVEEYDYGGQGLAYNDTEPENIPGGYRTGEGVDIGAHDNGYILEYVENGEWIEYTVEVEESGMYNVTAEVASQVADGSFNLFFIQSTTAFEFETPSTGSWTAFENITNTNNSVSLEAGTQEMRLNITSENPFNIDRLIFSLDPESTSNILLLDDAMKIYPNPAYDYSTIEINDKYYASDLELEVYKITGEKISTFENIDRITKLDIQQYSAGIYIVKVTGKEFISEQRMIVKK